VSFDRFALGLCIEAALREGDVVMTPCREREALREWEREERVGEGGERAAAAPCTARRSNPMPEQKYMVYARLGERAAILALSLDEAGRRRRRRSGGGGGQGICRYISTALITKKGFLFLRATKKGLFSYATCKQPRDYLINVDDDANATSQSIARSTVDRPQVL
jgi:hypothetical protein